MKNLKPIIAFYFLAAALVVPNMATAQDEEAQLDAYLEHTNECRKLESANPGGLDALSKCRWVYDDIIRTLKHSNNSPKMFNALLYLAVQNNEALLSSAMVGKTEVSEIACKYISEGMQFKKGYVPNVTSDLDQQMRLAPLPRQVAEKCAEIFSKKN